jgi:hypothetical protein
MTSPVPTRVFAKYGSEPERVLARRLGFRVHDLHVETIDPDDDEIVSVRPATRQEIRMWVSLIEREAQ